ncbi:uncharacterized protein LOC132048939 [Lycium ferocissimum]|uniref:uncharacterized protein LOC132048939 n=1 Tax=Lycium ferocissimum TaxID=112874 RepID=UPI00281697E6|nr:uncharacterized protein LOC132048939 [Lycium ferocissimum]
MVNSITSRIHSWHAKFLSKGGEIVLIKHVLSAMPVHLLAAMKPPKGTFEQIKGAMIRFLWSDKESMRKYHWTNWESMCLPGEKGGVGLRCVRDVSNTFTAKQWWNLRTKDSLWKEYMMAKILFNKESNHQESYRGSIPDLEVNVQEEVIPNNSLLNEVHINGNWLWNRSGYRVPFAVRMAIQNITINFTLTKRDKAIWMPNTEGNFTISSAWNLLRKRAAGD